MNALRRITSWTKNAVVPSGQKLRRLPLGLGSGCQMQIDLSRNFLTYLGLYERELNPYFRKLVRHGYNCFDVGGKSGYYALILAKLSGGKVVSFECDRDVIGEMHQTFASNPYAIEVVEGFVGDHDSDTSVTLDSVADRTFVPDFIKMDIEGAEFDALRGADRILRQRKPSMIIEVHGKEIETKCIELLGTYGYATIVQDQRALLRETRPLEHNRWLICEGRDA